jgi:hypothetical protein
MRRRGDVVSIVVDPEVTREELSALVVRSRREVLAQTEGRRDPRKMANLAELADDVSDRMRLVHGLDVSDAETCEVIVRVLETVTSLGSYLFHRERQPGAPASVTDALYARAVTHAVGVVTNIGCDGLMAAAALDDVLAAAERETGS